MKLESPIVVAALPVVTVVAFSAGALVTDLAESSGERDAYPPYRVAPKDTSKPPAGITPSTAPRQKIPCERPLGPDESALCASWRASSASEASARWGFWQLILSFFALVGLGITLWFNKRAIKIALESGKDTERALAIAERNADATARHADVALQTSYAQLRPWLKLEVQGGVCRRLSSTENICSIHIKIINGGLSPAIQAGVAVRTHLASSLDALGVISLPTSLGQFAPIFPTETVDHSCSYQPKVVDVKALTETALERGEMPMIVFDFKVSYRSAFSDQVHETAFRYLVFGQGHDVEWMAREREVGSDILPRLEMRRQPDDVMT